MAADVLTELVGTRAGAEPARMFGSAGLTVRGKTFAMLVRAGRS
jgi:hypothetical protein